MMPIWLFANSRGSKSNGVGRSRSNYLSDSIASGNMDWMRQGLSSYSVSKSKMWRGSYSRSRSSSGIRSGSWSDSENN